MRFPSPLVPTVFKVWLLSIAISILAAFPPALPGQQPPHAPFAVAFPTVSGYTLDKRKITLPADFPTSLNLLVLSFERDQQDDVQSWMPSLSAAKAAYPRLQTWLLPVSSPANILYRWWTNSSIRSSTPASQPLRYTVPLYVKKAQFLNALQISSEKQIVLLLTDKEGRILWRSTGSFTPDKQLSLTGFLNTWPSPH